MSKQITKINYEDSTVEHGGILYDMEDLARLHKIFERLSTAKYLLEISKDEITTEFAYKMAEFIRDEVDDYCACESEMITTWYHEAVEYANNC